MVLLTPQVEPLSLVPLESPARESHKGQLDLPSTPDTSEAARDLRETAAQQSPALEPAPHRGPVLSQGKPAMLQHRSPSPGHRSPRHCSPAPPCTAPPPWSPRSDSSSESEPEAYISRRGQHHSRHSRQEEAHQVPVMPWPPQWQALVQWPFWTPWAYHQAQGLSSRSLSIASDRQNPPSASMVREPPKGSEPGTTAGIVPATTQMASLRGGTL